MNQGNLGLFKTCVNPWVAVFLMAEPRHSDRLTSSVPVLEHIPVTIVFPKSGRLFYSIYVYVIDFSCFVCIDVICNYESAIETCQSDKPIMPY